MRVSVTRAVRALVGRSEMSCDYQLLMYLYIYLCIFCVRLYLCLYFVCVYVI